MVGGCCGTTPDHIRAIDAMLRAIAEDGFRPAPKARAVEQAPQLASLFSAGPLRQENAYLSIGERCNANGSKRFRELQEAQDWDGCVAMGREQQREGAHTLDLCTPSSAATRWPNDGRHHLDARQVDAPIVFDSTEYPVLEMPSSSMAARGS
jgi:5-methyltetrahydrofolate--homocysteine methyltransferase